MAKLSQQFYNLRSFLSSNRYFLAYCFLISVVAFGFELGRATISIDDEIGLLLDGPYLNFLGSDRWGMYILNWLFIHGSSLPYFPLVLAMGINVLIVMIALETWQAKDDLARYLAAVFGLTMPTIAFVYQFNMVNYGFYLGMLSAVSAAFLFEKQQPTIRRNILIILLLVASLSIYQSTVFGAPVVLSISFFIKASVDKIESRKIRALIGSLMIFFALIAIAILSHFLISYLIRHFADTAFRYHTVRDFYSGVYFSSYDTVFVVREIAAQLLGHRWYIGWHTGGLILVCILMISRDRIRKGRDLKDVLLSMIILSFAILSPFALVIVTSHIWPARTFMALPILFAGLVFIASTISYRKERILLTVWTAVCYISFVASNTRLFYTDHMTSTNDRLLTNRIVQTIEMRYGDILKEGTFPIVFIGDPKTTIDRPFIRREETFGHSIYEWDAGHGERPNALLRIGGVDYFRRATPGELKHARQLAKAMSNWPAKAAIKYGDGIFILKFSDEKNLQAHNK